MSALGRVALVVFAALAFVVALLPSMAVVLLGAPGFTQLAGAPAMTRAAIASIEAAGVVCAIGWPAGVLAAFGIWGARPAPRRWVIACALLALFAEAIVSSYDPDASIAALMPPIAAAASVVLLTVTGALNTIDPRMLQTGAACGASPARAWLTIIAVIRPTLILAAAAALSLGLALCTGLPGRLALAGLLHRAMRVADVALAPEALILAMLTLAPFVLAWLLLAGRGFRQS